MAEERQRKGREKAEKRRKPRKEIIRERQKIQLLYLRFIEPQSV
jgi:hypothetical protein